MNATFKLALTVSVLALTASQALADTSRGGNTTPNKTKQVISLVQQTTGDISANLALTIGPRTGNNLIDGLSLSATAAAMGNSMSILDITSNLDPISVNQSVTKNVTADLNVDIKNADIIGTADAAASITGAALGNSFSISGVIPSDLDLGQSVSGDKIDAAVNVKLDGVSVDVLKVVSTAIGNSATIGDLGNNDLASNQTVASDVSSISATLNLNNALSYDGPKKDDDKKDDDKKDYGLGDIQLLGDELSATVAALGNSLSIDTTGVLTADITQNVGAEDITALANISAGNVDAVSVTTAAIGNSLSANLGGAFNATLDQTNTVDEISATSNIQTGVSGVGVTATTAAIGNTATFSGVGQIQLASLTQKSGADIKAVSVIKSVSPQTFSAVAAAIGNTMSITGLLN